MATVIVDQKYRIKGNRSLLTQPVPDLTGSTSASNGSARIEILCECSDPLCNTTLVVLRHEYAQLRPEQRQHVVAVGHEVEFAPVRVTRRTDLYEFVEPWRP
jgi:hypothetical protein